MEELAANGNGNAASPPHRAKTAPCFAPILASNALHSNNQAGFARVPNVGL
jgi:hypothetical protein